MSETRRMLSGNQAIALGAWEAGVAVGCGYPGTPSTEILEALQKLPDVYTEWSVNEKVALEVGLGASVAGGRALVTMKHVGVNVAADPLFTSVYTGVNGGVVVITADDPEMHSSQNEQDNRNYAIAAKMPMFEPSNGQEAREFVRLAFRVSERFDVPVFVRTTTRLSHSKFVVTGDNLERPDRLRRLKGFDKNPRKYVMIPGNAKLRRHVVEERLARLREYAETCPVTVIERRDPSVGVITSGIAYSHVREVLPEATVLKLGLVNPLPRRLIEEFAACVETLYVVEELDPVIETQVRSWGIACHGKDLFPAVGEFTPDVLRAALGLTSRATLAPQVPVTPRRPELCPGCPHDHVFEALRELGAVVSGDIGCYTLATLPPHESMDTCLDMGASITMAHGMDAVLQGDADRPRIAAVIGDSTFAHSGITGLLNAVWNKRDGLYIVLDNGTTAMTGAQPNPASGERMGREDSPGLDYALLAKAINIPDENYATVDAMDGAGIRAAIENLLDKPGVKLLTVIGLCVIEAKNLSKLGRLAEKRDQRRVPIPVSEVVGVRG